MPSPLDPTPMAQPLSDYFIHEAGEFLDRMDTLLAGPDAPAPEAFFRLARGVRGSAQIAGAEAVGRVADRLEDAARAVRDGDLAWSDELRERARATAQDLRAMVDAHAAGGAGSERRAEEALARWGDVTPGRPRGPMRLRRTSSWRSCAARSAAWWRSWTGWWGS
jgi:HPt (histidine-containing phosphotransfer) domain-containing protein